MSYTFCNQCGVRQKEDRAIRDEDGRAKLYADIAHPINSRCREMIQDHVIRVYREELERSRLPGYVSRYEDFDDDAASHLAGHDILGNADHLAETEGLRQLPSLCPINVCCQTLPSCDTFLFCRHDRVDAEQGDTTKDERRHRGW